MLFIHNDVVAKLLTMRECIEAQEHAFRQVPSGGAIQRPRLDMYVPCERDDGYYRWSTVEGTSDGILAMRMKSDVDHLAGGQGRAVAQKANTACKPGTYAGPYSAPEHPQRRAAGVHQRWRVAAYAGRRWRRHRGEAPCPR